MKIAVLGAGTMGSTYVRNLSMMRDVQLVGVFDMNMQLATTVSELGHTKSFTSLDVMLEQAQPDVVCVCLPTYLHKEYVIKLAEAGKHIICEKPLALTVEDAEEMEQVCIDAGVRLFVGHVLRFFPNYADLKQKIDSELVGTVQVAHAKRYSSFPKGSGNWYADRSKSGGVILDLLIHDLDFLRWTIGEVNSVYTLMREEEGKQLAYVTLKFESGAMAQVSGLWGYSGPFMTTTELACDKGLLRLSNLAHTSLRLIQDMPENESNSPTVVVPTSPTKRDPYYYEIEHFIDCLSNNLEPLISIHDAKQAIAIACAAIQSALTGQSVQVPRVVSKGGINV